MPGLLIFIGIGIIFMTLLKARSRPSGHTRRPRRSDGDDTPGERGESDDCGCQDK